MLCHGYCAPNLRLSTIIPIVKNKKSSLNDSNNYRGIALSSIIAKLLDIIILQKNCKNLKSSDLQFGFKEKSSTVQCSFVVDEVVNYYTRNNGNVYALYLDASKAFDRVRFDHLFELLLERNICPVVARLLSFIYVNQYCRVKWSSTFSKQFNVMNGVKQGGVLSPLLFNIYLDVLLVRLKDKGLGCHVGNLYMGSFAYADDVVLLSPTLWSLKQMLQICTEYSNDYNIIFNAAKTKLIKFGNKPNKVNIMFQNQLITQVESEKHVGNIVGTCKDIDNKIITRACNELYSKFNLLMRQFGTCSPNIIYKLFNTFCMAHYGSQLWDYSNPSVEMLYVAWRKCIRKIFNIPYNTHCRFLHHICKDSSIQVKLHRRFMKFFINLCNSENVYVQTMAKVVKNGSRSSACLSLNYLCWLYNINKNCISMSSLRKISDVNDEDDVIISDMISCFLDCRDDSSRDIVYNLCTS